MALASFFLRILRNGLKYDFLPDILPPVNSFNQGFIVPFRSPIPPTLRDLDALRNIGAKRVIVQAIITGCVTGAIIGFFRFAYDSINEALVQTIHNHNIYDPVVAACLFGGLAVLAMLALLALRVEPLISGSGIPQVELMVRGQMRMNWLRVLLCKFFGTLVSLGGGLSVGREGPSIMMGAAVGAGVGHQWGERAGQSLPRYLVGGSVAGLAAAFGAPMAGMFFAFEEMKTILSVPMLLFTGLCALSAWFVVQVLFGFGLVFPFAQQPYIHWTQWWIVPAAGFAMGVLGAFYNLILLRLTLWADHSRLMPRPLRVLLPFMIAGGLLYVCPHVLVGFGIGNTLELEHLPLPLLGLFGLLAVKMAFSWISFASGVSGGLLMPVLLMGSLAGACMASGLQTAGIISPEQTATVLTLGMTGLFAGSVRAPLTGAFLLLEMTGSFHNMPAVVLTAYIAVFTANALHSEPVYDSLRARCLTMSPPAQGNDSQGGDSNTPGDPAAKVETPA